jgi:hypothetical protein
VRRAVRGVAFAGSALIVAACRDGTSPDPSAVARISVFAQRDTIVVGDSVDLVADLRDRNGTLITADAPSWRSAQPSVATLRVGATPLVAVLTAVAPGAATVEVTSARVVGRRSFTVLAASAVDVAITDAQWTQGAQTPDGALPMVLDGNAAVLNVLLRTSAVGRDVGPLVLTLSDEARRTVYVDTVRSRPTVAQGTYIDPSAQFLIPARVLRPGLRWRVVRDPLGALPDRDRENDAFPASGPRLLATVVLPPMHVRVVPVTLARHDNLTAQLSPSSLDALLLDVRRLLPWSGLTTSIAPPMRSTALFGTPPTGGSSGFFQQLMAEVEALRINDTTYRDAYWIALSPLPREFSRVEQGGAAVVPRRPALGGSASVLQANFDPGFTSRSLAHEIGHLLGREHAPCGNPPFPDALFPSGSGWIGEHGHDVFGWATGLTFSATPRLPSTADVMSYCLPVWVSPYTYGAMLAARRDAVPSPVASVRRESLLVVRGTLDGHDLRIVSLRAMHGFGTRHARPNATVELLDTNGRVFATTSVTLDPLDHWPGRAFTATIPLAIESTRDVASVRLTTEDGVRAVAATAPPVRTPAPPSGRVDVRRPAR